ncbi:MAG: hypothetical protein NVSMB9_05580 [Isosphaeraceae bacterium]
MPVSRDPLVRSDPTRVRPLLQRPWLWAVASLLALAVGAWGILRKPVAIVDPDRLWQQAEADFNARAYDRAEAALARLARLRSPTPHDWILRAQMAMLHDRDDEAIADLNHVPDQHQMAPQARLLAGQLELRRGRLRTAETWLLEAVRLDPNLVQPHRELIYLYGMQLRRHELNAQFHALARLAPLSFDNIFHWCLTRNTDWEPREIIREMRKYLVADPDDRWSRLALAENLRVSGDREQAENVLSRLPDDDTEARVIRVRIALDRGDDRAAEALLARGPENHPDLARFRGRLALARRDGASALKHFRAAYAAEPDHRDTILGLAQALAMAGKPEEAAPLQAQARDHDRFASLLQRAAAARGHADPKLARELAASCEKIHRFAEARAWYSLVIQANPLDVDAQKALFRLKPLETPP